MCTDFARDFEDLRFLDIDLYSTSAFECGLKNKIPFSIFRACNRNWSKEYYNVPVEIYTADSPSILRIFHTINIFYHTQLNVDALNKIL